MKAFTDRTFKFVIKPPETTWFLRRAAKMDKFTPTAGLLNYGSVSLQHLYEVAKIKKELDPDLKDVHIEQILNVLLSARRWS